MKPFEKKIWLSSPTMHVDEQKWVNDAFEKNWITTAGENVNEVEKLVADKIGCKYAVALSCGTGKILMIGKLYAESIFFVMPLILFDIYKSIDHGFSVSSLARSVLTMVVYIAISNDYVNRKYFLKVCLFISEMASVLIICQYICFYILGFHLKLVSVNLLLPESSQWIGCVTTGLVSITGSSNGYYRPSAFFLEPSHFFLFVFPQLLLTLTLQKVRIK